MLHLYKLSEVLRSCVHLTELAALQDNVLWNSTREFYYLLRADTGIQPAQYNVGIFLQK